MKNNLSEAKKGMILVVKQDSPPDHLTNLYGLLSEQGYIIEFVPSEKLAIEFAVVRSPDLILLDILSSCRESYQICQKIKSTTETCDIPVIFFPTFREAFNPVKAFSVGGDDFFTKSIDMKEASARIKHQLDISQRRNQQTKQKAQLPPDIENSPQEKAFIPISLPRHKVVNKLANQSETKEIEDLQRQISHINHNFITLSQYSAHSLQSKPLQSFNPGISTQDFYPQDSSHDGINRQVLTKQQFQILQQKAKIIDQIQDSVIMTDLQGTIINWNTGAEKQFGYLAAEILGESMRTLCSLGPHEPLEQRIIQPLLRKGTHTIELQMRTHSNESFPAHLSLSVFKDETGKTVSIIGLLTDISERKRVEAETLKSMKRERELNELQTRFASMVSHEYRTPLTSIISSLDLLEHYGHRSSNEEKAEFYLRIRTAVQRMTTIMNDVLTLNKSEAGLVAFNPMSLDVVKSCKNLVTELQRNIETEHQIQFICEAETLPGRMDERIMHHIFSNLISNAVKYSPEVYDIKFVVLCQNQSVIFTVQDQGIGIPSEGLDKLFQSYFRAENVDNFPGTGLGLSIVKQLVDIHQGSISVESQANSGSTFRVTLPLIGETKMAEMP